MREGTVSAKVTTVEGITGISEYNECYGSPGLSGAIERVVANFCAAIPNFRVMEIDIDDVPWKDDLVTTAPEIVDGCPRLPTGPGWGTELNEEAIRAHPSRRPH